MGKISVFNYEAYYLDFLEGNLNGGDTALFLEFLAANPDLKIVDELLPSFSEESISLDPATKESLKHHSEDEVIIATNIEHFLIAQSEGLLSDEKSVELDAFIVGDSALEKEKAIYSAVQFKADKAIVFADKKSLKIRKALVLWPYYTAAASVLIAMLVWYSNTNGELENKALFAKENQEVPTRKENDTGEQRKVESPKNSDNQYNSIGEREGLDLTQSLEDNRNELAISNNSFNDKKEENQKVKVEETPSPNKEDGHEKTPAILESIQNEKLVAISQNEPSTEDKRPASVYYSDLQNPIEPITSFIGEKINTEIDFRRQKKTKTKPSRIFVKIGKFEFSRKKH